MSFNGLKSFISFEMTMSSVAMVRVLELEGSNSLEGHNKTSQIHVVLQKMFQCKFEDKLFFKNL